MFGSDILICLCLVRFYVGCASENCKQVPVFSRVSLSLQKIGGGSAIFACKPARLPSPFTIFDIVLDRMRLGKLGTSFHFSLGFHYLYRKNILIRAGSASGSAEQVGLTTGCSLSAFELLCVRYAEKHPVFIVDRHLPVHLCREPCCGTGNPGASGAGAFAFRSRALDRCPL